MKLNLRNFFFIFLIYISNSCVETFEYKTLAFESALVVEATITNETKLQKIKLTRAYKLEEKNITPETGAIVIVIDDQGNTFNFNELSPGEYISNNPFAAIQNRKYQLTIKTNDNKTYTSNKQEFKSISPIQNVRAEAITSNVGGIPEEGISIIAESFDPSRNSNFYRYEFEETYRITSPFWSSEELKITSRTHPFEVELIGKTKEDKICYVTKSSDKIIITETTNLSEDRVNFSVNFIKKEDSRIKDRYSVLVKQHIQSLEAYTFYKVLDELSSSDNLFSQIQPGVLIGNLFSDDNPNENVLGFFEVTSVTSKRLFFNYTDFYDLGFPGINYECTNLFAPALNSNGRSPLIEALDSGAFIFYREREYLGEGVNVQGPGNYVLVKVACGDCTILGTNIKPTFWVD